MEEGAIPVTPFDIPVDAFVSPAGFAPISTAALRRSGVIASPIAACQKLQTHEYTCSEALATAVGSKKMMRRPSVFLEYCLLTVTSAMELDGWS